jgi:hypothetical protein
LIAINLRWSVIKEIPHRPPPNVRFVLSELQNLQSHPTSLTQPNRRCGLLTRPNLIVDPLDGL